MLLQAKLNLVEQNCQKQIATGFYLNCYFILKVVKLVKKKYKWKKKPSEKENISRKNICLFGHPDSLNV